MSEKSIIGIDLGTTNSLAAIYEADGKAKVIPNTDGENLTPSVVNYRDEDQAVVGTPALHQMAFAPEYTVRHFKRAMGRCDESGNPASVFAHPDSGQIYTAERPSADVVRYLAQGVEAALGVTVGQAVITVPAYFQDPARQATLKAGEMAGLQVLSIINEPTAAAIAYGYEHAEAGVFTVFDLGGGTFDVTILEIQDKNFRVLSTDGDRDLGGSDIDMKIQELAVAAFEAEHGIKITPESDLPAWLEISSKCEVAKKILGQNSEAGFIISAQGKRTLFKISRPEFDTLIASMVGKTRTITEQALGAAGVKPEQIKDTLLVGGSTRIIAVRDMLTQLFGKPPRTDTRPDEAVAMGAAIYAARMGADARLTFVDTAGKKVLPPTINMVDVNSHGLGCLALVDENELNCVIIPPNTELPTEREDVFTLHSPDQTEAKVVIAQGHHHACPDECTIIGEVILSGLPRGPHTDRIRVRYGLTREGTLTIHAEDKLSGISTSDVKRGLTSIVTPIAAH